MGLVLNRPTPLAVCEALRHSDAEGDTECGTEEVLYQGGPCEGPLMALHGDKELAQDEVLQGVYLATDKHLIGPVLAGAVTPAKFYAGYAGWGEGQLEGEIAAGAWVLSPTPSRRLIFEPGPDLWVGLTRLRKAGEMLRGFDPKILPRDPSMN